MAEPARPRRITSRRGARHPRRAAGTPVGDGRGRCREHGPRACSPRARTRGRDPRRRAEPGGRSRAGAFEQPPAAKGKADQHAVWEVAAVRSSFGVNMLLDARTRWSAASASAMAQALARVRTEGLAPQLAHQHPGESRAACGSCSESSKRGDSDLITWHQGDVSPGTATDGVLAERVRRAGMLEDLRRRREREAADAAVAVALPTRGPGDVAACPPPRPVSGESADILWHLGVPLLLLGTRKQPTTAKRGHAHALAAAAGTRRGSWRHCSTAAPAAALQHVLLEHHRGKPGWLRQAVPADARRPQPPPPRCERVGARRGRGAAARRRCRESSPLRLDGCRAAESSCSGRRRRREGVLARCPRRGRGSSRAGASWRLALGRKGC